MHLQRSALLELKCAERSDDEGRLDYEVRSRKYVDHLAEHIEPNYCARP